MYRINVSWIYIQNLLVCLWFVCFSFLMQFITNFDVNQFKSDSSFQISCIFLFWWWKSPYLNFLFCFEVFSNHILSIRSGFNQLQPVSTSYSRFLCFRLSMRVIRNKILVSKYPVFVIHHLYPAMLIIRKCWVKLVFCISHIRHDKLLRPTY